MAHIDESGMIKDWPLHAKCLQVVNLDALSNIAVEKLDGDDWQKVSGWLTNASWYDALPLLFQFVRYRTYC